MITMSGLLLGDIFYPVCFCLYLGVVFVMLIILVLGSANIGMGFYLFSHCTGKSNRKEVAFSFDDGPDSAITSLVLDLLKEQGIKTAFFVIGTKASGYPELINRMDREGHIIGGHSFTHHFFFDLFSARRMKTELIMTADSIRQITGRNTKLFRAPYGVTNPTLARVISDLGYHSIGWSLKSKDTISGNAEKLLKRLKKRIKPGDIILFHDTKSIILRILPQFIAYLKKENYQIVSPDQLLNIEAYE